MSLSAIPEQRQLVRVRGRQWAVASVEGATAAAGGSAHHLVHLASVDDELGDELDVVWELEAATEIADESALPDVDSFDPPQRLDAFLDAVRWGAAASVDYRTLSAPFRAGIEIEDYQLDPVIRKQKLADARDRSRDRRARPIGRIAPALGLRQHATPSTPNSHQHAGLLCGDTYQIV